MPQSELDFPAFVVKPPCKIIGERLKGSGMRWVETGATSVGALRALYVSGAKMWDGFWQSQQQKAA